MKAPKTLREGYAYKFSGGAKGGWKASKDDYWDTVMFSHGRNYGPPFYVGRRTIDGVRCNVFGRVEGLFVRYYAQTDLG